MQVQCGGTGTLRPQLMTNKHLPEGATMSGHSCSEDLSDEGTLLLLITVFVEQSVQFS